MADSIIVTDSERGGPFSTWIAAGAVGVAAWLWQRQRRASPGQSFTVRDPAPVPPLAVAPAAPSAPSTPSSLPSSPPRYVGPSEPLSRAFDPIFAREGQGIPVAYLRALAAHESDLKPDLAKGPAWGLMQVVEVVRRDYNERHGTSFERRDLLDPTINVRIAADMLAFIVESYRRHHTAPNLIEDWQNPRFVELLTFGWNAGYSERAGVGRVVRYVENTGTPVTVATVQAAARSVGASAHLSDPMKVLYARAVTATYVRERERDAREGYAIAPSGASIRISSVSIAPAEPTETTQDPHLIAVAPAPIAPMSTETPNAQSSTHPAPTPAVPDVPGASPAHTAPTASASADPHAAAPRSAH